MQIVNMLEAKSSLSRLVDLVERGLQSEIIIARNGRPAARLVPVLAQGGGLRLGVAEGRFVAPASIDKSDAKMAKLFKAG